jgi:hypothetical protein
VNTTRPTKEHFGRREIGRVSHQNRRGQRESWESLSFHNRLEVPLNLKNQTQCFAPTAYLFDCRQWRETQTRNLGRVQPSDVLTLIQRRKFAPEFFQVSQHNCWRFDLLELLVTICANQQGKSPRPLFLPTVEFKPFHGVLGDTFCQGFDRKTSCRDESHGKPQDVSPVHAVMLQQRNKSGIQRLSLMKLRLMKSENPTPSSFKILEPRLTSQGSSKVSNLQPSKRFKRFTKSTRSGISAPSSSNDCANKTCAVSSSV